MFNKIKGFISKRAKRIGLAAAAAAMTCLSLAVSAFAAESTESSSVMSQAIDSAGSVLQSEFSALVATLCPMLVTIAIAGLGMYAVIMLFKYAKKLFANAAG